MTDRGPHVPSWTSKGTSPPQAQRSMFGSHRIYLGIGWVLGVVVPTPLEDVAGHVIKTKSVGRHGIDLKRMFPELASHCSVVRRQAIEIRLLWSDSVAEAKRRRRAGAASEFPLRLGRETITDGAGN